MIVVISLVIRSPSSKNCSFTLGYQIWFNFSLNPLHISSLRSYDYPKARSIIFYVFILLFQVILWLSGDHICS